MRWSHRTTPGLVAAATDPEDDLDTPAAAPAPARPAPRPVNPNPPTPGDLVRWHDGTLGRIEPATWTEPGDLVVLVHITETDVVAAPRLTIITADLVATNKQLAGLPIWVYTGTLGPKPAGS